MATILFALLIAIPSSSTAQMIEGTVVSSAGEALPYVAVVLFDETYEYQARRTSDERGRFSFHGLEPGRYVLSVEQPGRLSVPSVPLEVNEGDTVIHRVVADAPPLEEMAARSRVGEARKALEGRIDDACGEEAGRGDRAVLTGVVRDTLSGFGVPAVDVVLRWTATDGGEAEAAARTSREGRYVICDAPAGEEVVLRVEGLGPDDDLLAIVLDSGTAHILDIPVDASEGVEPGQLAGRVVEYETGRPVANAEVRLHGEAGFATVTNTHGYFLHRDVPPGRHLLSVQHLGYGEQEHSFVVLPGRAHELEVRLVTEAIELEPIEVTVRPSSWLYFMDGLQFRMRKGGGHFLVREDIEMRGPNVPIGSLIDVLPGVDSRRGGVSVGRTRDLRGRRCSPWIWVDGVRRGWGELRSNDVEAIEVYTRPSVVPGEFGGGLACGAIVIWTRRW